MVKQLALITVAWSSILAQQTIVLTLSDAEQRALQTSKSLQVSQARIQQAISRTKEISTSKLPSLQLQGGYSHLSPVPPFQFTPPFPGAQPVTIAPVILDQSQIRLQLQHILFAGGRILASEEAASYQAQAAADDYRVDQTRILFTLRSTYWNLYKLRSTRQALQQTLRQLEARLQEAENLKKAGIATQNDVLKLRVQLASTKATTFDVEAQEKALAVILNNLIGLPLNTAITLATEPTASDTLALNLDSLLTEALSTRPDIAAAQARIRASEAGVTAAKASWFPTIALTAGYLYANPNQRILPNRKQFDGTWDVGINLSWNAWNWLQPQYQLEQARAQYEQAKAATEAQRDNAAVEITQNYVALQPARERISVAHEALLQAEENYSITVNRFNAGLATSTDLLDAETMLLQARINEINARADYMIAYSRLLNSLGK